MKIRKISRLENAARSGRRFDLVHEQGRLIFSASLSWFSRLGTLRDVSYIEALGEALAAADV
jgi:hypothetical protein